MKTIKFSFPHLNLDVRAPGSESQVYRIEQVTDSIEFKPGQQLKALEVDALCKDRKWKVTIVRA